MATVNSLYLDLLNLLKANISEVNSRVYTSFPKKRLAFPLIVLELGSHGTDSKSTTNIPLSKSTSYDIYVYSQLASEGMQISEEIVNLLQNHYTDESIDVSIDKTIEQYIDGKIYHETLITINIIW